MKHSVLIVVLIYLLLTLNGSNVLFAKKKIDARKYKKVGILVIRVGNDKAYSPMPRITQKTDYSIRKPTKKINIYINDEKRLSESVPNYPLYTGSTKDHILQYYKNFSPEITCAVIKYFKGLGFEANSFRVLAKEMNIIFSEMSIKSILSASKEKINALFILHYMDIGSFLVQKKEVKSKNWGFGSLLYSIAMFDVKTQKRLFYYSPIFPLTIENSLAHDVFIMNNPESRGKIKIDCESREKSQKINVNHSFTYDELINHIIRIILYGLKCPKKPLGKYHKKIKCYSVKGLKSVVY